MRTRMLLATLSSLLVVSCGPKGPAASSAPGTGSLEQHFVLAREIHLEERGDSVLSDIGIFRERTDGGFLVTDRHVPWVRVHDAGGKLVRVLGGEGKGPGQFEEVSGVVETPAGIYVSDRLQGRITRYTHDLELDTIFRVGGFPGAMDCCAGGDILLDAPDMVPEAPPPGDPFGRKLLHLVDPDMRVQVTFMRQDSLVTKTPYWMSFSGVEMALLDDEILAADDFLYPIHVFDRAGRQIRDFGFPPPSWHRAPPLARGQLTGPQMMERAGAWLATFTVIDRLGVYRDSLVVVTHAHNTPSETNLYGREDYGIDVYDRKGTKLLEDLTVPGRVVGVGRYVYVVRTEPPDPWVIGAYELTEG